MAQRQNAVADLGTLQSIEDVRVSFRQFEVLASAQSESMRETISQSRDTLAKSRQKLAVLRETRWK